MPDYRRYRVAGRYLFLHGEPVGTAAGYALLRHVHALREAVRVTRRERPFYIDAWVVLPDHLHCVWTLPPGDDDFSNRWRAIKIRFVQALPAPSGARRSGLRRGSGEYGSGAPFDRLRTGLGARCS